MSQSVERNSLDLRFQAYRLRNKAAEARLLASIAQRGIEQPLAGVDTPQARLLLDGFRRYRCAEKLGIQCVPYVSWGDEETQGIASLMRPSQQKMLSILEQARFVTELLTTHQLSMAEVAELLSRSKAWVSARRHLLTEMSPVVQEILFRGAFPVYAYMTTLRPFMRMNGVDRFAMKCFLHEALLFWGYAAGRCIIDNTNLARLRGAGSRAVICPEMQAFSKRYGFQFFCHALDHPNRKAGNERAFRTVETNFFRGRTFESLEDLNRQAKRWATERMEHRRLTKTRLIPAKLFEHERLCLHALPPHLPAPYQEHRRGTDQYGYVAFAANYYWVPGTRRQEVKLLEYADRVKIFTAGQYDCLAEYPLPPDGVRLQHYSPPGQPKPRYQPRNRHRDAKLEEQRLRGLGDEVAAYLDFVRSAPGVQRHRFTRELFALSRKLPQQVLLQTVRRALRYRIVDLATIKRIAWLCLSQQDDVLPEAEVDEDFQQRPAYQEGCLTDVPDLSVYDQSPEDVSSEKDENPEEEHPPQETENDDQPF